MPRSTPVPAERTPESPTSLRETTSGVDDVAPDFDSSAIRERYQDEQYAIHMALAREFRGKRQRSSTESGGRIPHAILVAAGRAAPRLENPDHPNAANIDRGTGTIVVAEGGTSVGVRTMTRGLTWAVNNTEIHQQHPTKAPWSIYNIMRNNLPRIIDEISAERGIDKGQTETSAQVVQIVDDSLAFTGEQPIYVYSIENDTCAWINEDRPLVGKYKLDPGQNIIVTSNGHRDPDTAPPAEVIADRIRAAIAAPPKPLEDDTASEIAAKEAQHLAENLQTTFAEDGSDGTITVSLLEVQPWEDERHPAQRIFDYARASHWVFLAIARQQQRIRQRTAREIYESKTPLVKGFWRAVDAAALVGLPLATYWAIRSALNTDDLPHQVIIDAHASATPDAHATETVTVTPEPTASQPAAIEPTPSETTPVIVPQAPGDQGGGAEVKSPYNFPVMYNAVSNDPLNAGHASSVTGITWAAIQSYGERLGLPQDVIDGMKHDPDLVSKANDAFMHDTSDRHNALVLYDDHHWLNEGDSYSTHDLTVVVREHAEAEAHRLGLQVPGDPVQQQNPEPPDTTTVPPEAVQPTAEVGDYAAKHARAELTWLPYAAGAAVLGAAGLLLYLRNRRYKSRHARPDDDAGDDAPETVAAPVPSNTTSDKGGTYAPPVSPALPATPAVQPVPVPAPAARGALYGTARTVTGAGTPPATSSATHQRRVRFGNDDYDDVPATVYASTAAAMARRQHTGRHALPEIQLSPLVRNHTPEEEIQEVPADGVKEDEPRLSRWQRMRIRRINRQEARAAKASPW